MKKITKQFVLILIICCPFVSVNAQFFAEGSMGVSFNDSETTETGTADNTSSTFGFNISPSLGYWLNDHIAVGASATIGTSINRDLISDIELPDQGKYDQIQSVWGFHIFGRYKLAQIKKFSLLLDSSIGIDKHSTKNKTSSGTKKINSGSAFGIYVTPFISYDLSEKFSLRASCSVLNLGFSSGYFKNEESGRKYTHSRFEFSTDSGLLYNLGTINIGIIYNF